MKNKLTDLNDHLFAQLERLGDESLKGDDLKTEIQRGKAVAEIGSAIIESARVTVEAMKIVGKGGIEKEDLPLLITGSRDK
jgi:hypothetical protein